MDVIQLQRRVSKNVVFLIGNGFDLGLGLKTSYRDFIDFYLNKKEDDSLLNSEKEIIRTFKEQIKKDIDCWSDAELEFGRFHFSELIDTVDIENIFSTCADDLQRNLCKYLQQQEDRFAVGEKSDMLIKVFRKTLLEMVKRAPSLQNLFLMNKKDYVINFNFINFNYTSTFDQLAHPKGTETDELKTLLGDSNFLFFKAAHVHGGLQSSNDLLFGVNDVSQIKDPLLFSMSNAYGYGIKPMMATHTANSYASSKLIVEKAHVIVLFGLSYGATDKVWWEMILDKTFNKTADLILCSFTDSPTELTSPVKKIHAKKQEAIKLLKHTQYGTEDSTVSRLIECVNFLDLYGPHPDPENGKSYYCDPLHLNYFKRHCIQGAD